MLEWLSRALSWAFVKTFTTSTRDGPSPRQGPTWAGICAKRLSKLELKFVYISTVIWQEQARSWSKLCFYLWNTGLETQIFKSSKENLTFPPPLPPPLKSIWRFFPKLVLPRKQSFSSSPWGTNVLSDCLSVSLSVCPALTPRDFVPSPHPSK